MFEALPAKHCGRMAVTTMSETVIEKALDELIDEIAKMGKAMDRDSKQIAKLEAEVERLREVLKRIEDFPWIASGVRDIAREALQQKRGDDE